MDGHADELAQDEAYATSLEIKCVCACLCTDMHVEGQPQETGMGTQQPSHGHCESLCPLVLWASSILLLTALP